MNPFRFLALSLLFAFSALVQAQDEPSPFGNAFAPTFTFSETYRQGIKYSAVEEDFLDQTTASLACKARVSMQKLDPGAIKDSDSLFMAAGNLSLELLLSDGTRSVVDGTNVVRWKLEGTDPDTGDTIENACTVTLSYNATELVVQVASANAPDDFNILALEEAGAEEKVESTPISFNLSVGPYALGEWTCYASGTASLYKTTVNGELFEDLANVTLTGEFDNKPPVVKILQPRADVTFSKDTIEISGTASDNHGLTAVEISLNGGPFVEATLEEDGTWRVADVVLATGLNSLMAHAVDESGNIETSAIRTFEYAPHSQLTVSAGGNAPGSVSAAFLSRLNYSPAQSSGTALADLVIDKEYTVVATPGDGALFDHWSSNATLTPAQTTSSRLVFTMTENLALTAHFVINPFLPVQGRYAGLLTTPEGATSGLLIGKVSPQGAFSLKAKFGHLKMPLKGRFSIDGHFTTQLTIDNVDYTIDLTVNVTDSGERTITGSINAGESSWTILSALSPFRKKAHPVSEELIGSYNFLLPVPADQIANGYPAGIGFGRVAISRGGAAKFTGRLADGTAFSGAGLLSGENRWPVFRSLYGGEGSISGWVTFDPTQADHDLSGTLDWKKPGKSKGKARGEGFTAQCELSGAKNEEVTALRLFSDVSLSTEMTLTPPIDDPKPLNLVFPFTLPAVGRVTAIAPLDSPIESITCKVQARTGLVTGSLIEEGVTRKLQGLVVRSKVNQAGGFILRNGYSTAFSIAPSTDQ